ncbi:MAG: tRNA (guanosine(46)-N7)-methyltransferase TrmB, partial [Pseudomonadota bacterium]
RKHRTIRSYVLREGRLTKGQKTALDTLWPRWGISLDSNQEMFVNWEQVFERVAPVVLEIGFGNGDALVEMARANPQKNYVGVEVHKPGVGRLLLNAQAAELTNIRVFCADGLDVLARAVAPASLDSVLLFFPDPWHKKKHNKRRILQDRFIDLVHSRLATGGLFHFATDWQPYAEEAIDRLDRHYGFVNSAGNGGFALRPPTRPLTKFEQRGQKLGHDVFDILMVKR